MRTLLISTALLAVCSTAALAADAPPQDAQPLSQIMQQIEDRSDFAYIDEVEWEHGVYEVEYITTSGAKMEINIDPISGEQVN